MGEEVIARFAFLLILFVSMAAHAQGTVQQFDAVSKQHLAMWIADGSIMDAGGSPGPGIMPQNNALRGTLPSGLGIVNSGLGNCQWTGYSDDAYSQVCSGFDGSGNVLFTVDRIGGGPDPTCNFRINGVLFPCGGGSGGAISITGIGPIVVSPSPLTGTGTIGINVFTETVKGAVPAPNTATAYTYLSDTGFNRPNCASLSDAGAGCTGGAAPTSANPTAQVGIAAVNGTAPTFMTSDSAPAIPVGTDSVFGVYKIDNVTITAPAGVLQATASGITQLTGDVTAGPGSGSQVATLATVNSDIGSFTCANITANGKGLITAAANGSCGGGGGVGPGTLNHLSMFDASTTNVVDTTIVEDDVTNHTITGTLNGADFILLDEPNTIVAFGEGAAQGFTGFGSIVALGIDAAFETSAVEHIALGDAAGEMASGNDLITIGEGTGSGQSGNQVILMGTATGQNQTADDVVCAGDGACVGNTGDDTIGIGDGVLENNTGTGVIAIGNGAGGIANSTSNAIFITNNSPANYINIGNVLIYSGSTGVLTLPTATSAANCSGQPSGSVIATTGTGVLVQCP